MFERDSDFDPSLIADLDSRLRVGALVIAKRDTGVCSFGEPGVCYERYELGGRPGWSFIFAKGDYCGFSPGEVAEMLTINPVTAWYLQGYRFANVTRLGNDYRAGLFDRAFEMARKPAKQAFPSP